MTINSTAAILLALYVAAAEKQGVARDRISRDDPERHPQGVHRPRHVDLPAAAVDAPRDRHLRVRAARAAPLEHDLDLRLPHARGRGDGRPGARLHARRRDRLRRGGRRPRPRRSTTSPAGCRSSSPPGPSCSRRSPSSGRPAGCGPGSCRERFGASNARSMMCRFHVQTAGSSLTAQSIDNNVVRTTVQALAAVLGGAQSLHTNARDEALALPTEESARLALRTQQILAHEAASPRRRTRSPARTSSRRLTNELEAAAQALPRRDRRDGRHAGGDRGAASSSARSRSRPTGSSRRSSGATRSSSA